MFDNSVQVSRKTDDLRVKLEKHLGVKASNFRHAVKRAGRMLPRRLRKQAQMLIEAEDMASHPKLARRIDTSHVAAALRDMNAYLDAQNLAEKRKTRVLGIVAGLAFNLLIFGVLLLIVLRWRGLI